MSIAPKLKGDELRGIRDRPLDGRKIELREVRIEVTGKKGTRYFAREARRAA